MPTIQDLITETLTNIEADLAQIERLRKEVEKIEKDLFEVSEDYRRKLGALNDEARTLNGRIHFLKNSLNPPVVHSENRVIPPSEPDPAAKKDQSPKPRKDPRYERKRDLADYLRCFIDRRDIVTIERINAVLADDNRDAGEMLEMLPWGPIWQQQGDDETSEEHLARLKEWQQELEQRIAFWEQAIKRLENDGNYWLLLQRRARNTQDWLAFLDEMARDLAQENAEKRKDLVALEQAYEDRHA